MNSTANLPAKLNLRMHSLFIYMLKLKCTCAENSSRVNLPICAQSLADNFTDDITARKNKNSTFFLSVDSKKLKNYSVGWWTQTKDISDAGLMAYARDSAYNWG